MAEHRNLADPSHPEQPKRILRIFERLEEEGLAARCLRIPCREATRRELERKHAPGHVDAMLALGDLSEDDAKRRGEAYNSVFLCPASSLAGLLAAGGVLQATAWVSAQPGRSAACVVRPPGHHAECGCAMGFGLFGNVALAAADARCSGRSERTLIVDWDVHHGNGTQNMFHDDPTVLYFSAHRYDDGNFYPGGRLGHFTSHGVGAGAGYSVNVPWDVRGGWRNGHHAPGDPELVAAFEHILLPVAKDFDPDLVLVSAGFDAADGDPLGGCKVTPAGFHRLTTMLMGLAGGRVVLALEGGYSLEAISASMAACVRALLGDPAPEAPGAAAGEPLRSALDRYHARTLQEVRLHLATFWPSLAAAAQDQPEFVDPVPAPDSAAVPPGALVGDLFSMQLALKQHAEATGGDYDDLRRRHELLLFKLDGVLPKVPCPPPAQRFRALEQSFGQAAPGVARLLPVIHIASVAQAVRNVGIALGAGADGVWLTNSGHAEVASTGAECSPPSEVTTVPRRVNLRAAAGAEDEVGWAQLRGLGACFAAARAAFPGSWLGIRVPQLNAAQVFHWLAEHCSGADGVWLDDLPCKPAEVTWERVGFGGLARDLAVGVDRWLPAESQGPLRATRQARSKCGWIGLVCGTIAVGAGSARAHHQQDDEGMGAACRALLRQWALLASHACDVVVTSAPADGSGCAATKLAAMEDARPLALGRSGLGLHAPATASGAWPAGGPQPDLVFEERGTFLGSGAVPRDGGEQPPPPSDFDEAAVRAWVTSWRRAPADDAAAP